MIITIIQNGTTERFHADETPAQLQRMELIEQRRQRAKEYYDAGLTAKQSAQHANADFAHKLEPFNLQKL